MNIDINVVFYLNTNNNIFYQIKLQIQNKIRIQIIWNERVRDKLGIK